MVARSLAARRARVVDRTVVELFCPAPPGTVLLAVGGYGRRQLSPGSDVDLLLVHDGAHVERPRAAFEAVLYPLWDAHLRVGHALRTVDECRALATDRVDALTALLTARRLSGSTRLFRAVQGVASSLIEAHRAGFVDALAEWRMQRELRAGRVGDRIEPDLKEALGGMRDLQLLHWLSIGDGTFAAADEGFRAAMRTGLLDHVEARWAKQAWSFLLLVREALQRVTGDAGNRLSAASQDAVAVALGYEDEDSGEGPAWPRADALLRDLAVASRRAELTTAAALDRSRRGERVGRAGDADPRPLLAARGALEAGAHPARAAVSSSRPARPARPWSPQEADAFVELLAAGDRGSEWLAVLDAVDALAPLLPPWLAVRGRPQRDPFHTYPVDVHLLRTAAELARLLHRPDEPFAARAVTAVDDTRVLLLGGLLHDIGKIGRRDHVRLGVELATSVIGRMGIAGTAAGDVLFLVAEHLLLSDTATRRDLQDEDLVVRAAATIGDPRRLAMLYLLTMADARATGPHAVSQWRLGLIRELVAKVQRAFGAGLMDADRGAALRDQERALRGALESAEPQATERFLEDVPPAYLSWAQPSDAQEHVKLLIPPPARGEVRMARRAGRIEGTHLVTVAAVDRVGLLADLAGAFALARYSILSAQAFTTESGIALDVFEVRTVTGDDPDVARWKRLEDQLALVGTSPPFDDVARRIGRLREEHRARRSPAPIEVRVDAGVSAFSTVIEVSAPDRLGLLFDLTRTFVAHGLDVHAARVATYGPRVIDVFYVTTADGEPVRDTGGLEEVKRGLVAAAEG